jgi:phosphoketolase
MEVVSSMTNFVTSSQITSDGAKPLKIMKKLRGWSLNNEAISSQMNHSSSTHEEPMTNANRHHRIKILSQENKDLVPQLQKTLGPHEYVKKPETS